MACLATKTRFSLRLKQVLPLLRPCRNFSLTLKQSSKLYELRTYTLWPANVKDYLQLTRENFHLRTAHSKLCGFWITELGGINEVNHIWEFDSFAHRTEVRQKVASDQVWIESYFSRITPFLVKQENAVLMPTPLKELDDTPVKEGGVYELCRYEAKPGCEGALMRAIMNKADFVGASGSGKLMGLFSTEVGHNNSVYHLWNYENMDKRQEVNIALSESTKGNAKELYDQATSMTNKLMLPFAVSPLK